MNHVTRDKCIGRRLIASGGDFGIRYAAPPRPRSVLKAVLASVPFIALAVLVAIAVFNH